MKLKSEIHKIILPIACFCLFFALGFLLARSPRCKAGGYATNCVATNYLADTTNEWSNGAVNRSVFGRPESNWVVNTRGDDTEMKPTIEFKFTPQSELIQPSKFSNAPVNLRVIGGYFDGPDGFGSDFTNNYMKIPDDPIPFNTNNKQVR